MNVAQKVVNVLLEAAKYGYRGVDASRLREVQTKGLQPTWTHDPAEERKLRIGQKTRRGEGDEELGMYEPLPYEDEGEFSDVIDAELDDIERSATHRPGDDDETFDDLIRKTMKHLPKNAVYFTTDLEYAYNYGDLLTRFPFPSGAKCAISKVNHMSHTSADEWVTSRAIPPQNVEFWDAKTDKWAPIRYAVLAGGRIFDRRSL